MIIDMWGIRMESESELKDETIVRKNCEEGVLSLEMLRKGRVANSIGRKKFREEL